MLPYLGKLKIGKNNKISRLAKIYDNVIIGNNNFIGDNVVIYPHTIIGNNNNIFNNNIIGEFAISSDDKYNNYNLDQCKGVYIGNNNLLHVKNIIFSGIDNKTHIGDNNKFLGENHIGHDAYITKNVTTYPRIIVGGYSKLLEHSNIGMAAIIHQRCIIGQYSMIGANNTVTKNIFPYFININNKIHRINEKKTHNDVKTIEPILRKVSEDFYNKKLELHKYELPEIIRSELQIFINECNTNTLNKDIWLRINSENK